MLKKQIRTIRKNIGTLVFCVLVISLGILTITSLFELGEHINDSLEIFYDQSNYYDAVATVENISDAQLIELQSNDKITDVAGMYILNGGIKKDDVSAKSILYFVNDGVTNINIPTIVRGRNIIHSNEILLHIGFSEYHDINIGDSVMVNANNKDIMFRVAGLYTAPHLIYHAKPTSFSGEMSYIYASKDSMSDFDGMNNAVLFRLSDGVSFESAEQDLKYLLTNYNMQELTAREHEESYAQLHSTIASLRLLGTGLSIIICFIGFIMSVLLINRMITRQSKEIAILKSLGYQSTTLCIHYMIYGVFIMMIGMILGQLVGYFIAKIIFDLFKNNLLLPSIPLHFNTIFMLMIMGVSVCLGLIVGYLTSKKILKMEIIGIFNRSKMSIPRGKLYTPKSTKGSITIRYAIRNMMRNKHRTLMILSTIMFCFSISTVVLNINTSNQKYSEIFFPQTYRYDIEVVLAEKITSDSVESFFDEYPEIERIEFAKDISVKTNDSDFHETFSMLVLPNEATLYGIFNDGEPIGLPKEGICMSKSLLKEIGLSVGNNVTLVNTETSDKYSFQITEEFTPHVGSGALISKNSYQEVISQQLQVSTLLLSVHNSTDLNSLIQKLENDPTVLSAKNMKEFFHNYRDNNRNTELFLQIIALLGIIIAVIMFVCIITISLAERNFELSLLRVMGLFPSRIGVIVTIENLILSIVGIALGVPLSIFLFRWLISMSNQEVITVPYIKMSALGFLQSFVGMILVILLCYFFTVRRIKKLSLTYSDFS